MSTPRADAVGGAFEHLSSSGTWPTDPGAHGRGVNEYGETISILELG